MPSEFAIENPLRRPTVLVVGSGRSGTTWLSDEIAARTGTHPVFEPLHCYRVANVPHWGLRGEHAGMYLTRRDQCPEMQQFFERLLDDELSNAWTRQDWRRIPRWAERFPLAERVFYRVAAYHNRRATRQGTHSVIKLIKSNLMLDWIDRHFDVKLLYVIRHPCQVIGSRMKHDWQGDLADITEQANLMQELQAYRSLIDSAQTPLQQLAVFWCVENRIPLQQAPESDWLCHTYEACVIETPNVFASIDQWLDASLDRSPSPQEARRRREPNVSQFDTTRPWHHPLTEREGEEVLEYCEGFGIQLYGKDSRPQTTLREALR